MPSIDHKQSSLGDRVAVHAVHVKKKYGKYRPKHRAQTRSELIDQTNHHRLAIATRPLIVITKAMSSLLLGHCPESPHSPFKMPIGEYLSIIHMLFKQSAAANLGQRVSAVHIDQNHPFLAVFINKAQQLSYQPIK